MKLTAFRVDTQADVSSPDIKDAYEKVRNDKDDTTWLLLDFEGDKSDKLALTETGTGVSLISLSVGQSKETPADEVHYRRDLTSSRPSSRTSAPALPTSEWSVPFPSRAKPDPLTEEENPDPSDDRLD